VPRTAMSETYDFLFTFLVIGNAGTGKSCLLHQFIENKFKDDSNHTIGIINGGGKYVKLQIRDTAGQARFRGAAGALLVCSITSLETSNALPNCESEHCGQPLWKQEGPGCRSRSYVLRSLQICSRK
uniref:Uncharacterized protein n=1 Tax=Propithecus coquereli TaxID=379532 RepID=A0A2K6GWH4_PROCO